MYKSVDGLEAEIFDFKVYLVFFRKFAATIIFLLTVYELMKKNLPCWKTIYKEQKFKFISMRGFHLK